ncbi:hypothetical protein [Thermus tenuipuniceus]|uniref:hypothetical protein n=1 Tax=Thermus tenuipuniceus TaxID=2078690 RepID=UPI000CFA6945|nr:hypothetical protein [Thermus tenuipuniceus]
MELKRLVEELRARFPKGLDGEREGLVRALAEKGTSPTEAERLAEALEAQSYAHYLPGEKGRWVFLSKPLDLTALMRTLDQEYREFVGEGDEEEEVLAFLTAKLEGDRAVAQEVLEALRLAGYVEKGYSPELERDRLIFHFPEALRLLS